MRCFVLSGRGGGGVVKFIWSVVSVLFLYLYFLYFCYRALMYRTYCESLNYTFQERTCMKLSLMAYSSDIGESDRYFVSIFKEVLSLSIVLSTLSFNAAIIEI